MTTEIIAVDTRQGATHIVTAVRHWTRLDSKVTVLCWRGGPGYRTRTVVDVADVRELLEEGRAR